MSASEQAIFNYQYNNCMVAESVLLEQKRPFMLLHPRMFPDGDKWCALYGVNLQEGVAGFGKTPHEASINFDIAWLNETPGVGKEDAR